MARFTSSSKLSHGTDAGLGGGNSFLTQVKGVLWIGLFVVTLSVVWVFIATPQLRGWGVAVAAVAIMGLLFWQWRKRARRPSIEDAFTDLGDT